MRSTVAPKSATAEVMALLTTPSGPIMTIVGVLVAVVKLVDLASVTPGIGLIAFVVLMLMGVAASVTLDREFVWQHVRRDGRV